MSTRQSEQVDQLSVVSRWTGTADSRRRLATETAGVGLVALVMACAIYRVWAVAMRVPFEYHGDANLHAAFAKRMTESTWYIHNDRLGAPLGLDNSDFPLGGENLHWLAMKIIGFVVSDPGAILNVHLLITYATVASATYLVSRIIGLRRWSSITIALLFAFLPYHLERGVSHSLRTGYYILPFLLLAVAFVAGWRTRFSTVDPTNDEPRVRSRRGILLLVLFAVVIGASDTQNSVYASIVLVMVGSVAALTQRHWIPIGLALLFTVTAALSLVVNNAPFVLTTLTEGSNVSVATRPLDDQPRYSLRPAGLVLPVTSHRFAPFDELMQRVRREAPYSENTQSLGMMGSIGLVAGLIAAGALTFTRRTLGRVAVVGVLGMISAMLALIASSQGFSFLLSLGGITMLRTWNRVSLLIGLFALVSLAILVELAADRIRRPVGTNRRLAATGAAVALVIVGVGDQVPVRGIVQTESTRQDFERDRAFYRAVEASHPTGANIFQYPVVRFPEGGPVGDLEDYETLTGYLHTNEVRWSTAPINGRAASYWQFALAPLTPHDQALLVAAAGFHGVVLYDKGLVGNLAEMPAALTELTGQPRLVEPSRRLQHFDLASVHEQIDQVASTSDRAALTQAITRPVRAELGSGAYRPEINQHGSFRWIDSNEVELTLVNDEDTERSIDLSFSLGHIDDSVDHFLVTLAGADERLDVTDGSADFRRRLTIAPGTTTVMIASSSAASTRAPTSTDSRTLGLQVAGLVAYDSVVTDLLCQLDRPDTDSLLCR